MKPYYESNGVSLYLGDCREVMPQLDLVHAIICDPPYELGFMGKKWDNTGIAYDVSMWEKALCPPSGGILLDPFMGSGSTIIAGRRFYQHCIGIELEEKYIEIAAKRLSQEVFDFGA